MERSAGGGRVVRRDLQSDPECRLQSCTHTRQSEMAHTCLVSHLLPTITRIYFPKELSRLAGYVNEQQQKHTLGTQTVGTSSPMLLNKHSSETRPSEEQRLLNDLLVELKSLWCENMPDVNRPDSALVD